VPPAETQRRLAFGLPARAASRAARFSAAKILANKRSGFREGGQRMNIRSAMRNGDAPLPLWEFEELWNCIFLSFYVMSNRALPDIIASMPSERFPSFSHFFTLGCPEIGFLSPNIVFKPTPALIHEIHRHLH